MKNEEEIKQAIIIINGNNNLTYGYKEDVLNILRWVIGYEETFDGLED